MDWKQFFINLLVIGIAYSLGYISSYFFSKRYVMKKKGREKDEK